VVVRGTLRLGLEVVPLVLVALLVCHLIRTHVLEWYLVPSSSMEPTLHGDPLSGDVVLVNKTAYWFGEPERFDLVVLRNPDDAPHAHLVKRVVAWGEDERNVVRVDQGDVFLGRSRQDLRRHVKQPGDSHDLRLTHFVFPEIGEREVTEYFHPSPAWSVERTPGPRLTLSAGAPDLASLEDLLTTESPRQRRTATQPGPYLPGHLSTRRPVNTTFLDDRGRRWGSHEACRDVGMEFEIELDGDCAGLQMVLEYRDRYYAFRYSPRGRAQLLVAGETAPAAISEEPEPPLPEGRPVAFAFGYLDGRFFLEVEDRLVLHCEYEIPDASPRPAKFPTRGMHNLLHLGVAGGSAHIPRIRVFHDVYYKSLRAPFGASPQTFELQPGEMFLLGDNTFDSRDSRTGRTFARADLVGRPLAVIGPLPRVRWLIR
jgi:signal peptidase I